MTQIQTFQYTSFKVQCICINGDPWFRGKDVAWVLGYVNTMQALIKHVDEDDKLMLSELLALENSGHLENRCPESTGADHNEETIKLSELLALENLGHLEKRWPKSRGDENSPVDANAKKSIYISEGGLWALMLGSKKPEAKAFKKWVTSTVLPSIRKSGSYAEPTAVEPPPPPPPAVPSIFSEAGYKEKRSFVMEVEDDLHFKVVDYIRRFYPVQ